MHDGTTTRPVWSRARYCVGVSPTISVKRELNEPSEVQPTAMQTSVTDISPWRRSACARSILRVCECPRAAACAGQTYQARLIRIRERSVAGRIASYAPCFISPMLHKP